MEKRKKSGGRASKSMSSRFATSFEDLSKRIIDGEHSHELYSALYNILPFMKKELPITLHLLKALKDRIDCTNNDTLNDDAFGAALLLVALMNHPELPEHAQLVDCLVPIFVYVDSCIENDMIDSRLLQLLKKLNVSFQKKFVGNSKNCQFLIEKLVKCAILANSREHLQMIANDILITLFAFPSQRLPILDALISFIEKNPKLSVTFVGEDVKIMNISLMLMSFAHAGMATVHGSDNCSETLAFFGRFIMLTLNKYKDKVTAYVKFVGTLIDNLLTMSHKPEWPGALLILNAFIKHLIHLVCSKYSRLSLRLLTKVAVQLKKDEEAYGKTAEQLLTKASPLQLIRHYLNGELTDERLHPILATYHRMWPNEPKPKSKDETKLNFEQISKNEAEAVTYHMRTQLREYHPFIDYVKIIVNLINTATSSLKREAAHCLGDVVRINPDLLSSKLVGETVQECFRTNVPYLRTAVAKIIGKYLLSRPDGILIYFDELVMMIRDDSLSVRKACIQALSDVFQAHESAQLQVELTAKILSTITDEIDGLKEVIVKFASKIWLRPEQTTQTIVETCLRIPKGILKIVLQEVEKYRGTNELTSKQLENVLKAVSEMFPHKTRRKLECINVIHVIAVSFSDIVISYLPYLLQLFADADLNMELRKGIADMLAEFPKPRFLKSDTIIEILEHIDVQKYSRGFIMSILDLSRRMPHNDLEKVFKANLEIIKNVGKVEQPWREVVRALWIVFGLCNHLTDSPYTQKILQYPLYQQTLVFIVGYTRLYYVSPTPLAYLENIVADYLKSANTDENNIKKSIALWYLTRSLHGYNSLILTKKSTLKEVGDKPTEALSSLFQNIIELVLECVCNRDLKIRRSACEITNQLVESGLMLPSRLIPSIIAMSSDPDDQIVEIATTLMKQRSASWDLSKYTREGFHLAIKLKNTITGNTENRGFDLKTNNAQGHLVCRFVEQNSARFRNFIEILLDAVSKATDPWIALYLSDNIVSFKYKTRDQVLYILYKLGKIESLAEINIQSQTVAQLYPLYLLMNIYTYLENIYSLDNESVRNYNPALPQKDPIKRRSSDVCDWLGGGVLPNELNSCLGEKKVLAYVTRIDDKIFSEEDEVKQHDHHDHHHHNYDLNDNNNNNNNNHHDDDDHDNKSNDNSNYDHGLQKNKNRNKTTKTKKRNSEPKKRKTRENKRETSLGHAAQTPKATDTSINKKRTKNARDSASLKILDAPLRRSRNGREKTNEYSTGKQDGSLRRSTRFSDKTFNYAVPDSSENECQDIDTNANDCSATKKRKRLGNHKNNTSLNITPRKQRRNSKADKTRNSLNDVIPPSNKVIVNPTTKNDMTDEIAKSEKPSRKRMKRCSTKTTKKHKTDE